MNHLISIEQRKSNQHTVSSIIILPTKRGDVASRQKRNPAQVNPSLVSKNLVEKKGSSRCQLFELIVGRLMMRLSDLGAL